MASPLDQYEEARKTAGIGSFLGRMGQGAASRLKPEALGGALVVGGATVAATGLGAAAQKIIGAITKQRDFKRMLEHSPDLHDAYQQNPDRFNQQYTSLRNLNPTFAADPLIAANYMRQMSMDPERSGGVLVTSLRDLPNRRPQPPWVEAGLSTLRQPFKDQSPGGSNP